MAKNHRVELRLNDEDYALLKQRANDFGTSLTGAVESLLRVALPTDVWGVREVGVRGRRRATVGFSNGMVVHGFLWSRGGQLLAPSIPNPNGRGHIRIVSGTRAFWRLLRQFFTDRLGTDDDAPVAPEGEETPEAIAYAEL